MNKPKDQTTKTQTQFADTEKGPELIDGVKPVTMDDIEDLKDPEIQDAAEFYMPSDVLHIKEDKVASDPKIGHLVFRWLNPDHRKRHGMNSWQWVSGELAAYIRKSDIVAEAIGGGSGISLITSGDLQLAFMSKSMYASMKKYKRELAKREMEGVLEQDTAKREIASGTPDGKEEPDMINEITLKRTYEGQNL